jgi:hypothetical protein
MVGTILVIARAFGMYSKRVSIVEEVGEVATVTKMTMKRHHG